MAKEIQIKLNVDDSQLIQAGGSADNLRKQVRQATIDLENTAAQFGLTSQEAAKAAQKVGELKDKLSDARALASAFDADKKFTAVAQSLQGVLGGFQAVQGAMAAFGVENEDVQKSLLKIQGLMAFTTGINQVLAAKDSFKNLGVVIGATTGIQKLFTATTAATSTALNAVGVSSTAASVGVRAFSSALIATGIGAIVVALGLGVKALMDWADNTEAAKQANDAFSRSLELAKIGLDAELGFLKRNGAERIAQAKAQGKSQADLTKITNENIDSEIESLKRAQNERVDIYEQAKKNDKIKAEDFKKISDEYIKGDIETTARIRDLQSQQTVNNYAQQEQQRKDAETAQKKRKADSDQFHKKQVDAQKEAADMIARVTREANQILQSEDEKQRLSLQNQRDDDLAKLKANLDAKLITQKQYNDAKTALDLRLANQTSVLNSEIDKKNKEKADEKQKKDLEEFVKKSKEKLDLALQTIDNDESEKQRVLDEKKAAKLITDMDYENQTTQLAYDSATQREAAVNTVIEQGGQYKTQLQTEFSQESNQLAQSTADTQTGIAINASAHQIAIEKAKTDALKELQNITIGNIADFGKLVGMFGEQSKGLAIAAIVIEQGSNIAKIVMDTQREIAGYYASYSAIPFVGPGIASGLAVGAKIRAGIGIATSVAAAALGISKINSANKNSTGGGGGGVPSLGSAGSGGGAVAATSMTAPSAPSLSAAATPTVGLSTANPNAAIAQSIAGAQQRPVQAYVVSTAVTSQQALDRRRRGNGIQNSSDAPVQTALSTGG